MSWAYKRAEDILNNPERWVAEEDFRRVIIYKSRDEIYCIAKITNDNPPYVVESVDNSLWFKTLGSAKRYAKNEMYVESRFNKAKR